MDANTLLELARAAGVTPKLPDGSGVACDETGAEFVFVRWHETEYEVPVPPAVALALTMSAVEEGLPYDWRVVPDSCGDYCVQRHELDGNRWNWRGVVDVHDTRADALAALLGAMKGESDAS